MPKKRARHSESARVPPMAEGGDDPIAQVIQAAQATGACRRDRSRSRPPINRPWLKASVSGPTRVTRAW
jgi:hypothetical protein